MTCESLATHKVIYTDGEEEYLCPDCKNPTKAYWGDAIYAILQLPSTFKHPCEGDPDDV